MQCPTCNHLNTAMAARCLNCGTTLIHEAVGHSKEYYKGVAALDSRMYTGFGSVVGFFFVAILLKFIFTSHYLSDREVWAVAVGGGVIGSILGRLFLKAKQGG
jgi:hypothetical protein